MLEVNAAYFILLAEGFGLMLLVLMIWILIVAFSKRRKNRNVEQLACRLKDRSAQRCEKTESFLQAVYQLEAEDLRAALENIDRREVAFFQQLLDSLSGGDSTQITTLDESLDKVFDSYKCLRPRVEEAEGEDEVLQELHALRGENEKLREELSLANNKLSNLLSEFGDMFGGGSGHELTMNEITEKVAALKAKNDAELRAQK